VFNEDSLQQKPGDLMLEFFLVFGLNIKYGKVESDRRKQL